MHEVGVARLASELGDANVHAVDHAAVKEPAPVGCITEQVPEPSVVACESSPYVRGIAVVARRPFDQSPRERVRSFDRHRSACARGDVFDDAQDPQREQPTCAPSCREVEVPSVTRHLPIARLGKRHQRARSVDSDPPPLAQQAVGRGLEATRERRVDLSSSNSLWLSDLAEWPGGSVTARDPALGEHLPDTVRHRDGQLAVDEAVEPEDPSAFELDELRFVQHATIHSKRDHQTRQRDTASTKRRKVASVAPRTSEPRAAAR